MSDGVPIPGFLISGITDIRTPHRDVKHFTLLQPRADFHIL